MGITKENLRNRGHEKGGGGNRKISLVKSTRERKMLLSESLKNVPKFNLHNFRIINAYLQGSRFGRATQKHINPQ
jgi:hypothetical protein